MKPNIISIVGKDMYDLDDVRKLQEAANVKFGPDNLGSYSQEQFLADVPDVDGIILDGKVRLDEHALQAASKLKVVSMFGVGYDIVDVEACTRHKVYVTNTPVLSDAVADLAFTLMLCLSRPIMRADKFTRGEWARTGSWLPLGRDLCNKTLGIIGLGRIGFRMAKRAYAFDMNILYTDVVRSEEAEKLFQAKHVSLEELLRKSDYVTVHMPLNKETRGKIGERELTLMKNSAFLINTSRGAVVDQYALTKHLKEKKIAGAGLDVFAVEPIPEDDPLLQLDNVVLSPHIGSATVETFMRMGMTAANNVMTVIRGEPPQNLVPEQQGMTFKR